MVIERIYEWARLKPAKPALIYNDQLLDYAAFARTIEAYRQSLERERLPAGTVAIVATGNLADAWVLILALRALGLTTIHVNSLARAEALRLKNVSCVVAAADERSTRDVGAVPFPGAKFIKLAPLDAAARESCDLSSAPQTGYRASAHILYTSGTTGTYKKVVVSAEHEDRAHLMRAKFLSFDNKTIFHGVDFGLWTAAGFRYSLTIWHMGGCVVLDQREDKFKNFFRHRTTFSLFIPWMAKALLKALDERAGPVDGFTLDVAGGFLPIDLAELVIQKITRSIIVRFAATELNRVCLYSRVRTKEDVLWLTAVEKGAVQIVDENGRECPIDQQGHLRILLSDIDCHEYLDDPEASAKVFRDGFFYPGDWAVRRADGRIRILGRTADVVNLKGTKIAVAPIEQDIQHVLQVNEVCIFSGLSEEGHEELIVAIESDRVIRKSQLEAVAARFVRFDRVRFSIRSEFPRTEAGTRKVNRTLLRKAVFAELTDEQVGSRPEK
jgi:acyl-coenzyme A synthetase/AMP-(fatty) acid ligase